MSDKPDEFLRMAQTYLEFYENQKLWFEKHEQQPMVLYYTGAIDAIRTLIAPPTEPIEEVSNL